MCVSQRLHRPRNHSKCATLERCDRNMVLKCGHNIGFRVVLTTILTLRSQFVDKSRVILCERAIFKNTIQSYILVSFNCLINYLKSGFHNPTVPFAIYKKSEPILIKNYVPCAYQTNQVSRNVNLISLFVLLLYFQVGCSFFFPIYRDKFVGNIPFKKIFNIRRYSNTISQNYIGHQL